MEWKREDFLVTDRPQDLDIGIIHGYLHESYWARGIPRATLEKALANSLCCGLYHDTRQIGFARAVTDRATFAYLADVFVLEAFRGQGLGKWLVSCLLAHPELQGLRRLLLVTADAHELYRQQGFKDLQAPQRFMEIHAADIYRIGP
ncbi:MAG: GNAT family N-acetyltransferase [Burkholderiaceae bacterium]|nr:GNAT family N-acetyltransferase [Burkholderiaceae bacterium]MCF8183707.1 GNAT family N-acetyltransferase [Polynucleobacter sp.]